MLLKVACNSFQGRESHFVLSSFVQQHKTQLLAKFKKFGKWGIERTWFFFQTKSVHRENVNSMQH